MNTVEIPLDECYEGDVLACDVFNHGVKLVSRNTAVNEYILKRLSELELSTVCVYDPPLCAEEKEYQYHKFVGSYKKTFFELKSMINDVAAGKNLKYDKVAEITDQIFDHVDENENIIKCLNELHLYDEYTYTHSLETAFYCMLIAKWMNMSEKDIKNVMQAGFLHDIGKAKISKKIINKRGPLTKEEYEIVKCHPVLGYKILHKRNIVDNEVKNAVLLHHERLDSSGYPFRIPTDNISLYSRIVAVADVYDAMTSDRVYKKKASPFKAFQMFKTEGISIFDPAVSNVFLSNMASYYIGSEVELNTGDKAKIVHVPPNNIISPIICINSDYIDLSTRDDLQVIGII